MYRDPQGHKITISFTLDDIEDRALLRELEQIPRRKRSETIRLALARYYGQQHVTLADLYQKLCEIEREIRSGTVRRRPGRAQPGADGAPPVQEPPEAAAALELLGQ